MIEKTIEILIDCTEIDCEVRPDSLLVAELGLSSLDVVSIVAAFEDEFDIEVPDRVIPNFHTVQDIADYMEANV